MSDRKQREMIAKQHLDRSLKSLKSSKYLYQQGFYEDAISRAYYAAYHAAYAMLYQLGFNPRTHKGLQNLFFTQIVQTGLLDKKMSRILARLSEERSTADYGALPIIEEEDSAEAIEMASAFVERIRQLLEEQEEK